MIQLTEKSTDRDRLVERLREDLVGPHSPDEVLSDRPSDVYLTGILWPPRIEMTGEDDDTLATGGSSPGTDNQNDEAEGIPANYLQKPSVAGISFCAVSKSSPVGDAIIRFGRYQSAAKGSSKRFYRKQITVQLNADLSPGNRYEPLGKHSPDAEGVRLHIRSIASGNKFLVTISLINETPSGEGRDGLEAATIFQTELSVQPGQGTHFVPRPATREEWSSLNDDADELSNDLLFRNVHAFATGHVCSASWGSVFGGSKDLPTTDRVFSTWLPSSIVPGVNPNGNAVFSEIGKYGFDPLSAMALSTADAATLSSGLNEFCDCYAKWIEQMRVTELPALKGEHLATADENLQRCDGVLERMRGAVSDIGSDERLRRAFQLCNLAMSTQHQWDPEKSKYGPLRWRPFQLGFLLLSVVSTVRRNHPDRETMDLLWFPTGGGKTEAYLALIALLAFYRRLSPVTSEQGGVAAIMRYTLRLLTTQQFARSASMVIACEAIRTGKVPVLPGLITGKMTPFSLGLWVGGEASPNNRANAHAALKGAKELASPEQLAECPVCHRRLEWTQATVASPVIPKCVTTDCILHGPLPVWTVDEDVYDERPTLLIGTVDKFAQIVRRTETNGLFGISEGNPPDLVIQDELHLISGPLGTIAAVYEAAFDILFSREKYRPKVIGSTATIRRASEQVLGLFDRNACQFPPPGVNHDDSGFAVHDPASNGRRYVGVTTAGRSAKFTLQAVSASLLQSAAAEFKTDAQKDPYWTLLGYFNSLRELGGALVLMQDDVTDSIELYKTYRNETTLRIVPNVEELTSRRTQEEILEMLGKLATTAGSAGALDIVLATNMVSVGVDIPRLGLMVVNGQPKAIAEYIQATSRVGRGSVSGLIVSVLNNAKARDRSRFETFSGWHQTLYKDVEATSVTPFASRARDRALHAALVAAVRHLAPGMLNRPGLNDPARLKAQALIDLIVARASRIDPQETSVRSELERRLDRWDIRSPQYYWQDYQENASLLISAERAAWKKAAGRRPGAAWPTLNSMRTVEAGTPFRLAPKLRQRGEDHGE